MNEDELIERLWPSFFEKEIFSPLDSKFGLIKVLIEFFKANAKEYLEESTLNQTGSIYLNVQNLKDNFPFDDFEKVLVQKPLELGGVIGLAVSNYANQCFPYLDDLIIKRPGFYNLTKNVSFSDIKSTSIGQLVSLEGHVVKVSYCRPLVMSGEFRCSKCQTDTRVKFEDGIYQPPIVCPVKKCYCRSLEFNRNTIETIDFQRIKLSEPDHAADDGFAGDEIARIPKTFEIELRESLVNCCMVGDVIRIVGVVKAMQIETNRSMKFGKKGMMETGINQYYILANSLVCVKGSGNRISTSFRADEKSAGFLLDNSLKHNPSTSSSTNPRPFAFAKEELNMIRQIAYLQEDCLPLLVQNFCPMIYGHELVKAGLLLALFGGSLPRDSTATSRDGSFKVRTNIHLLMVGDPGLGKSQMLRAAANVAPRAVYVTGNTSTTAGLTVTVTRDIGGSGRQGGELCIEAGALVLADSGVCCIDELDKISSDQHALLEAMEQQSISIAKSGIVTSLRSRTSVLSAANPVGGHYNRRKSISENLKLNSALLSRFDLIFILLDKPDEDRDKLISEHILGFNASSETHNTLKRSFEEMQSNSHQPDEEEMTFSQRLRRRCGKIASLIQVHQPKKNDSNLRTSSSKTTQKFRDASSPFNYQLSSEEIKRYIEYARQYVHPVLSPSAAKVLQKTYLGMRARTQDEFMMSSSNKAASSLPVTTRHLESMIRLAQARARIDLREEVTEQDANEIVQLLQESLLDIMTNEAGEIDVTRRGGTSLPKQMKALVKAMNREATMRGNNIFSRQEIADIANRLQLNKELDELIESMRTECYLLLKGPKLFQLQTV